MTIMSILSEFVKLRNTNTPDLHPYKPKGETYRIQENYICGKIWELIYYEYDLDGSLNHALSYGFFKSYKAAVKHMRKLVRDRYEGSKSHSFNADGERIR